MEGVRCQCGYGNGIDIDLDGRSGSLSLGRKDDCTILLRSHSYRYIDVMIDVDSEGNKWRCTGFFDAPEENHREASWNLLRSLNDCSHIPWIIIGDFNEITFATEKWGDLSRRERKM